MAFRPSRGLDKRVRLLRELSLNFDAIDAMLGEAGRYFASGALILRAQLASLERPHDGGDENVRRLCLPIRPML